MKVIVHQRPNGRLQRLISDMPSVEPLQTSIVQPSRSGNLLKIEIASLGQQAGVEMLQRFSIAPTRGVQVRQHR